MKKPERLVDVLLCVDMILLGFVAGTFIESGDLGTGLYLLIMDAVLAVLAVGWMRT